MVRTLILYESKYGFTRMIAKYLSIILGPAKYCRPCEFKGDSSNYGMIVICTPVYSEAADSDMLGYLSRNGDWIRQKKVILICTCLAENMADKYLKSLEKILGQSVALWSAIPGELIIDKLDSSDRDLVKQFCSNAGLPFNDVKLFNKNEFVKLALNIKNIRDEGKKKVDEQELTRYIEDFIKRHNTCALASGHDISVRATPIEYMYKDGFIYILSEGGEKFANIFLNPNVSVCIYDVYKSMNELGGMQITGTADIVETDSNEYVSVLVHKGLKPEKINSLPITLNLIKISIKKVEFLWSEFAKLGYDTKQVLHKENK